MIRGLLNIVLSNWPYKLASIILAVLVWYVVQGEEILEVNRKLEVEVVVPDGMIAKEPKTQTRDVTLRGPRALLGDFSQKNLQATIRVPLGRTGTLRYRIDKEFIPQWDNRIRLTVHDPYMTVVVDEKAARPVPVRATFTGEPKEGMMVGKIEIVPPEITVTGLKNEIQKLVDIPTEAIDIQDLGENKEITVPISKSNLSDMVLSSDEVKVNLKITEKRIIKKIDSIPVSVINSDYVSSVRPALIFVLVQGTPTDLNQIKRDDVQAIVDAKDLKPDRYEKEIVIRFPNKSPGGQMSAEAFPPKAVIEVYNQKKLK